MRPEDINYTRQAADADVRLTAFKQRLTPVVSGKVIYVSPDRLTDRSNGTPYYTAHVRVDPASLAEAGNLKLQAGMPAEVHIRHSARTPLQYLVDPSSGTSARRCGNPESPVPVRTGCAAVV